MYFYVHFPRFQTTNSNFLTTKALELKLEDLNKARE